MFNWKLLPQFEAVAANEPQYAEVVALINTAEKQMVLKNTRSSVPVLNAFRPDTVICGKYFYELEIAACMLAAAYKKLGIISENAECLDFFAKDPSQTTLNGKPCFVIIDLANNIEANSRGILRMLLGQQKNVEMIIFLGSQEQVASLRGNRQIAHHLPAGNWVNLLSYSEKDMVMYIDRAIHGCGCKLSPEAKATLPVLVRQSVKSGCPANGNGAKLLLQNILMHQANRLNSQVGAACDPFMIEGEDMFGFGPDLSGGVELEATMQELDNMIGLASVKQRVQELKSVAQVAKERAVRGIASGRSATEHMIFTGNAGTGKTSVARLIARIYYLLGLLENDKVVVATRSDLVAGHLGQTAIKTKNVIQSALGGVLFIDEAYSLYQGPQDSYGAEAVDTLLAEMENNRDKLIVIIAGYEQEIKKLLATNQGLYSRFPQTNAIDFPDYSEDELVQIYRMIVKQRGQTLVDVKDSDLLELINNCQDQEKNFGNARGIRNLVENAERRRDYRIAPRLGEMTNEELSLLTKADVLGYEVKPEIKRFLQVPYAQKEEAKKLGAKWDQASRKWYILYKEGDSLDAFSAWLSQTPKS